MSDRLRYKMTMSDRLRYTRNRSNRFLRYKTVLMLALFMIAVGFICKQNKKASLNSIVVMMANEFKKTDQVDGVTYSIDVIHHHILDEPIQTLTTHDERLRANLASKIASEVAKHAVHIEASMQYLDDAEKAGPTHNVFDAVRIALPLPPELLQAGNGQGQEKRARIGLSTLRSLDNCHAFVAGVNYEPLGTDSTGDGYPPNCRVHTFDCTMEGPGLAPFLEKQHQVNPNVIFHPWCVGGENAAGKYITVGEVYNGGLGKERKAYTIHQLMERTNITGGEVDAMQFDIEGYEWGLLEDAIIEPALKAEASGGKFSLPRQLAFELHTEKANQAFVSPKLMAGRDSIAVARLFRQLASIGYYVVAKEINDGDKACAEFVLAYTKIR